LLKAIGFITSVIVANRSKDALTGLGHACGHNLIAVSSVGAALATADVMVKRKLGGKVVLFGTPAEGDSMDIYVSKG
jgi:metal-dependent amidase/aminoacylase/carboxypeptidase family protein